MAPRRSGPGRSGAVGRGPVDPLRPVVSSCAMERPQTARLTTGTQPVGAVVVKPGTVVPGRARPAAPLRREGPAKLTGTALYTDDIVVPGAWYGSTIRSSDAHATFDALDFDPAFDWSKVVVVSAADIPGENIVSSIKSDQPILVPIGRE